MLSCFWDGTVLERKDGIWLRCQNLGKEWLGTVKSK